MNKEDGYCCVGGAERSRIPGARVAFYYYKLDGRVYGQALVIAREGRITLHQEFE